MRHTASGLIRFDPAAFTRDAAARHPAESRWSVFADVYQALFGAAVLLFYAGSLLFGVREELVVNSGSVLTRSLVSEQFVQLQPGPALGFVLLLAAAGGLLVLLRLGPVSATAAEGFWWLGLPVDRRRTLARPAAAKMLKTAAAAGLGFVPIAALAGPAHGLASVLPAALLAAAVGALLFLAAALIQVAGWKRRPVRSMVTVGAVGLVILVATVTAAGIRPGAETLLLLPPAWPLVVLHGSLWPFPVVLGLALAGLGALYLQFGKLPVSELTGSGGISGHAAGALYFGDFRGMAAALEGRGSSRRFRLSSAKPSGPFAVLVRADAVAFLRSGGNGALIAVLALVPAACASVAGVGSAAIVASLLLISGLAATAASSAVSRVHAGNPALDRLLPLTPVQIRQAHTVVPAASLAVWGLTAFGALAVMGAGGPALPVLGALAGVGMAGAATRGAFRPVPDWTAPGGSSFSLTMPAGIGAAYTRGPDYAVLALLPALVAVVSGSAPWWLVLLQLASSTFCAGAGTRAQ